MLTKKHFVAMAAIVKNIRDGYFDLNAPLLDVSAFQSTEYDYAAVVAEAFMVLAKESNPCFNKAEFCRACGLPELAE